jgi:hypothetical protein
MASSPPLDGCFRMAVMSQTALTSGVLPRVTLISKSKFLAGLQCPKLLWHSVNTPDQFPATDAQTQAIFDQGHEVGALAKTHFPGGLEVGEGVVERKVAVQRTRQALPLRRPLFEAALDHNGGYARADILNPVGTDEWEIVEVKSSTEVKEVFLEDIAFQHFVFSGAGLKIRACFILHVNNAYVRSGELDPTALLTKVDVTADAVARSTTVGARLNQMLQVAALERSPEQKIGPHCDDPYTCALHDQCWSYLPDGNVLELYRGKKKGFDLLDRGITRLADVPDGFDLSAAQAIQRQAAIAGKPHLDAGVIRQFLARLVYPLHFLDFESFMTAIPLFDGVRPYQQVPFQFSLHVLAAQDAEPVHHGFLAEGATDPRRAFINTLVPLLGNGGSIIVYNASFETGRLRECAELFPEFKPWLASIERRIVDLLEPFRAFAYYHPAQGGSASIKSVLPALTGTSYDDLEIGDGGTASREFVRVTFNNVPDAERQQVRSNLEKYCALDTRGMVVILDALRRHTFA